MLWYLQKPKTGYITLSCRADSEFHPFRCYTQGKTLYDQGPGCLIGESVYFTNKDEWAHLNGQTCRTMDRRGCRDTRSVSVTQAKGVLGAGRTLNKLLVCPKGLECCFCKWTLKKKCYFFFCLDCCFCW